MRAKTQNKTRKFRVLLGILLGALSLNVPAQLPDNFITKVTYQQDKTVIYEMPTESDLDCLKLWELAEYHGYEQSTNFTQIVDTEGDVLSETKFLYEKDVRDDWMQGYDKIVCGKAKTDVYYNDGTLVISNPREIDTGFTLLTPEQSANFKLYKLDQAFYDSSIAFFIDENIPYSESNQIITVQTLFSTSVYDHNSKTIMLTEYDSNMVKLRETATEYSIADEGGYYAPHNKTTVEWIFTEDGCCVRKTTLIKKLGWTREVAKAFQHLENAFSKPMLMENNENELYNIGQIPQTNSFLVTNTKQKEKDIFIVIYDMTGKEIMKGKVKTGQRITLPETSNSGMYMVHIYTKKKKNPIVGKIIVVSSYHQF